MHNTKMSRYLVIVESPAKCKTIEKFLGSDYELAASYGHVRDLPQKKIGVDIAHNFEPTYQAMPDKKKVLKDLKDKSKKAEIVYVATDPDREGEAIAWHIIEGIQIPEEKVKRIVFNEITKTAVQNAIQHSRLLDIDLVNAQQARRILDRLIGYKLSPVLAKKIRKGLSAGRVQSVAVKIICDRERAITAFIPEEYWNIDVTFSKEDNQKQTFRARLVGDGEEDSKKTVSNEADALNIKSHLEKARYEIKKIKKSQARRNPAAPFITSTLQQEASRKLGWTAKKTMMVAQQLYEGVTLNGESTGLITYMRTDSIRVSDEAKKAASDYIKKQYGAKYLGEEKAAKKEKKNVQDAHEAIRPSYIEFSPADISKQLSADHLKLYKLVWNRFMASQMSASLSDRTQVNVEAVSGDQSYWLRATGSIVIFDGFTKVYTEDKDHEGDEDEKEGFLPPLEEGDKLKKEAVEALQKFTQPPARFTEASLVKELELQGIGRPSTYAPTISTILDRGYVEREAKVLKPTELGFLVIEKLEAYFDQIVDLAFTANMETKLDEIAEGKHAWQGVLGEFYDPFAKKIDIAYKEMEKINTDKPTDEKCDKCGSDMVLKQGRFGAFIACSNFPECKTTKSVVQSLGVNCAKCGSPLVMKKSKRGKVFYGCSGFPNCTYAAWDKPIAEPCPKCKKPFVLEKAAKKGNAYKYCDDCHWKESDD